jgi:hypothetical protein
MRSSTCPRDAEVIWYGAQKQATPKRWRSKEAKAIVAAVQRAGGQVERTASGHLKVIGPAGSAIVASAPNTAAPVGGPSTTPWRRSGARPGCRCERSAGPGLPRCLHCQAAEPLPLRPTLIPTRISTPPTRVSRSTHHRSQSPMANGGWRHPRSGSGGQSRVQADGAGPRPDRGRGAEAPGPLFHRWVAAISQLPVGGPWSDGAPLEEGIGERARRVVGPC